MKNHLLTDSIIEEACQDLLTLRDVIRWTVSQFEQAELWYGHGTEGAYDESIYLIYSSLKLAFDNTSEMFWDARLLQSEKETILNRVQRRVNERVPVAYLVGEAWFMGLPIVVDESVLIPRSPFAELISQQFSPWLAEKQDYKILELCTGSGCIAIATALAFEDAVVDAVDISSDALLVAQQNVNKHHMHTQVNLIESDLFSAVKPQSYDLIIANPPYVAIEEWRSLPEEYHQEPKLGLVADQNGLSLVIRILEQAKDYLTDDGLLFVEVGYTQSVLEELLPDVPFLWLDFENGGEGIFMLTKDQLEAFF